jgi:hypothetical protein
MVLNLLSIVRLNPPPPTVAGKAAKRVLDAANGIERESAEEQ